MKPSLFYRRIAILACSLVFALGALGFRATIVSIFGFGDSIP